MNQMSVQQFIAIFEELSLQSCNREDFRCKLEQFITTHRDELPLFYSGHKIFRIPATKQNKGDIPFIYSGYKYSQARRMNMDFCQKEFTVSPGQCIGDAWLFRNDHTEGRPKPWVLADLLTGDSAKIPAPFLWKAGDYYLCTDGCHRIYASYLLNRTIQISYDYEYTNIEPIQ